MEIKMQSCISFNMILAWNSVPINPACYKMEQLGYSPSSYAEAQYFDKKNNLRVNFLDHKIEKCKASRY
jgi:hypothetical protein